MVNPKTSDGQGAARISRWRGTLGEGRRVEAHGFRTPAHLVVWFLSVESNMPWDAYVLSLIHLRDEPSCPPAKKKRPDCEHELVLWALDPTKKPRPNDTNTWSLLTPPSTQVQLGGVNDEAAIVFTDAVVTWILDGVFFAEPPFPGSTWPGIEDGVIELPARVR